MSSFLKRKKKWSVCFQSPPAAIVLLISQAVDAVSRNMISPPLKGKFKKLINFSNIIFVCHIKCNPLLPTSFRRWTIQWNWHQHSLQSEPPPGNGHLRRPFSGCANHLFHSPANVCSLLLRLLQYPLQSKADEGVGTDLIGLLLRSGELAWSGGCLQCWLGELLKLILAFAIWQANLFFCVCFQPLF